MNQLYPADLERGDSGKGQGTRCPTRDFSRVLVNTNNMVTTTLRRFVLLFNDALGTRHVGIAPA